MLPYIQIILAVVLVGLVLMQYSEAGAGSAFGGGDISSGVRTRRGPEKVVFYTTILVAILFVGSAITALILR